MAHGCDRLGDRARLSVGRRPERGPPARSRYCGKLGRYLHAADSCYCPTAGINHPAITAVFAVGQPGRLVDVVSPVGRAARSSAARPRAVIEVSRGKRG